MLAIKTGLLLLILLGSWIYWLWQRRHWYKFSLTFPTVWGLPLIGSGLRFLNFNNTLHSFEQFYKELKRHTVATWMGCHLVILTEEPEFVERVINSNDMLNRALCINQMGIDVIGGGLLSCHADTWQLQRKAINPAFQHKVLLTFFPIFNRIAQSTEDQLQQLIGQGPQQLNNMLKNTIINGSLETTMGLKPDGNAQQRGAECTYVSYLTYIIGNMQVLALLTFLNIYGLSYLHKKFQRAKKFVWQFTEDITLSIFNQVAVPNIAAEKDEEIQESSLQDELVAIRKPPEIFIKQALEMYKQQKLSWHEVISNANGLILASYETSATAVLSALIMLAMHPLVQERLYEELYEVFGRSVEEVTYADLEKLPYLDMIVNETLRLMPPIPILAREAVTEATLSDGLVLPKGVQVLIDIYHMHRRKDIWGDDADEFKPNRFLPKHEERRHLFSFIPFSKGQRNCLGWRYAVFSMKILVARFIHRFRITTPQRYEDLKLTSNVSLHFVVEPKLEIWQR